jgi:transcriptional regulator with GAF, ATPase, and Fis domain
MNTSEPEELSADSLSESVLRASHIVADLHQRASFDVPALLRDVIDAAVGSVPGADYAGITVSRRRRLSETVSATHRYPVLLDEIQNRSQQGPSLSAAALDEIVRIDDLADDDRWSSYRKEALAQTPVRSILSMPMFREGSTTSTLSFYAESTRAFDELSAQLGRIFATHAALVWNMMRRDQQFRTALVSRDVIGQAKGRMMERFNIDADAAFEMLKLMSQDSNTPIAQVAQRVVAGEVWSSVD